MSKCYRIFKSPFWCNKCADTAYIILVLYGNYSGSGFGFSLIYLSILFIRLNITVSYDRDRNIYCIAIFS